MSQIKLSFIDRKMTIGNLDMSNAWVRYMAFIKIYEIKLEVAKKRLLFGVIGLIIIFVIGLIINSLNISTFLIPISLSCGIIYNIMMYINYNMAINDNDNKCRIVHKNIFDRIVSVNDLYDIKLVDQTYLIHAWYYFYSNNECDILYEVDIAEGLLSEVEKRVNIEEIKLKN